LEYLAAQVDLNNDKSNLLRQQEIVETAKISLNELLGRQVDTPFFTVGSIEVNSNIELEKLRETGMFQNRNLLVAQREKNLVYLQERAIRAEKMPRLSFNLGYNYNYLTSEAGFLRSNQVNGISYGLTASWNVFNGRNIHRREQIAKVEGMNTELRYEELRTSLEADISRGFIQYQNRLTLLQLENENTLVAKENEEIALERYKLGVANPLELREAQINALNAELRKLNTLYDAKLAEIELIRLSGNILKQS
jgi:outer membrane protein